MPATVVGAREAVVTDPRFSGISVSHKRLKGRWVISVQRVKESDGDMHRALLLIQRRRELIRAWRLRAGHGEVAKWDMLHCFSLKLKMRHFGRIGRSAPAGSTS